MGAPPGSTLDATLIARISAAVDALIGGAPGALDTLNELAAALNDDESFAATVTGLLAAKQPLDDQLSQLAALDPTEGQIIKFDPVTDEWVVRTPSPRWVPRDSMTGPVAVDTPTVTLGAAADGAFNKSYVTLTSSLPAIWPVDCWGKMQVVSNLWAGRTAAAASSVTTYRFVTDADELVWWTYGGGLFYLDLYIDGKPYSGNPIAPASSTGYGAYGLQKLVFGSAKPRLIEFRTLGGIVALYVKNPYRIWKPAPDPNPRVVVIGDSFVYPSVMNDATAGAVSVGAFLRGIWQGMAKDLGITSMTSDGVGGSGYIAGGGAAMPYGHATRKAWLTALDPKPDVIVVHGGGANDIYGSGATDAAIITAAVDHFTWLRANFPKAKLVFVEGFAPPLFTPATYNPRYIAIRVGVQTALIAAGIDAYYLKVASADEPPIYGTGYVTAPTGVGNSDIYVGSDAVHLTIKGNVAVRGYLVPKMRAVLADDNVLVNTLI